MGRTRITRPRAAGALMSLALTWISFQGGTADAQTPPTSPVPLLVDGQLSPGSHGFTGLPLTWDGWTDWDRVINALDSAAEIVYVCATGDDRTARIYNPGDFATPTNPGAVMAFNSYGAAYSKLENGEPGALLLCRGSDYRASVAESISKAGAADDDRLIIGAYGNPSTARPIVTYVETNNTVEYAAIFDLYMASDGQAIDFASTTTGHILVEGVMFESTVEPASDFLDIVAVSAQYSTVRRSVFKNKMLYTGWPGGPGPGGAAGMNFGLLEENFHWTDPTWTMASTTHNVYLNIDTIATTSRWNTSINSPGVGWRQRLGGTIIGNLIVKRLGGFGFEVGGFTNFVNFQYNTNISTETSLYTTVSWANISNGYIANNIIAGGLFDVTTMKAWGTTGRNTAEDNIFWNSAGDVNFGGFHPGGDGIVMGPFVIQDNDFQASIPGKILTVTPSTPGFLLGTGNRYYSTDANPDDWFGPYLGGKRDAYVPSTGTAGKVSYSDPGRTIYDYMIFLGKAPSDELDAIEMFSVGAIANRRGAWDESRTSRGFVNYRRAGFDLPPAPAPDYAEPGESFWGNY